MTIERFQSDLARCCNLLIFYETLSRSSGMINIANHCNIFTPLISFSANETQLIQTELVIANYKNQSLEDINLDDLIKELIDLVGILQVDVICCYLISCLANNQIYEYVYLSVSNVWHVSIVSNCSLQLDFTFKQETTGTEVKEQVLQIRIVYNTIIVEILLTVNGTLELDTVLEILDNIIHENITFNTEFVLEGKYDISFLSRLYCYNSVLLIFQDI